MAVSVDTVWEVRTSGDDTNGGGFVDGATGTDYSQQDAAQVTYTDLVIGSTGNENKLTSAGNPFTAAHVGNIINITGGASFTTGRYQVVSVAAGVATMDRLVGGAGATGGTGKLGGAFATVGMGLSVCNIGGMRCYVQAGTYQIASAIDFPGIGGDGLGRIIGFTSTHGDGGRATIQTNADNMTMCTWGSGNDGAGYVWENVVFDGNDRTGSKGFDFESNRCGVTFYNCIFKRFAGDYCCKVEDTAVTLCNCEVRDNVFASGASSCLYVPPNELGGMYIVHQSYFTGNESGAACISVNLGRIVVTNSVFYDNADGMNVIECAGIGMVRNNVMHSNDGAGVAIGDGGDLYCGISENNIFTDNVVGIYGAALNDATVMTIRNNAYYDNTNDVVGFTDVDPITLTGLPYVSVPSDFALNSTAGAGVACQAAGTPGTIGLTAVVATGYPDVGAVQKDASQPSPLTTAYTFVS